jgi:hypothetical protein
MAARAEELRFQDNPPGGVFRPLLGWAAVVTVMAIIRRYAREPSLPRMSEHWLVSHQTEFNRDQYEP